MVVYVIEIPWSLICGRFVREMWRRRSVYGFAGLQDASIGFVANEKGELAAMPLAIMYSYIREFMTCSMKHQFRIS